MSSTASALITTSLLLFAISCGQQGNDVGPPTTVSGETDSTAGTDGTTSGNGAAGVGGAGKQYNLDGNNYYWGGGGGGAAAGAEVLTARADTRSRSRARTLGQACCGSDLSGRPRPDAQQGAKANHPPLAPFSCRFPWQSYADLARILCAISVIPLHLAACHQSGH